MKRKWVWALMIAVLLAAVYFAVWSNSRAAAVSHVRRNQDALEIYAENCMEQPEAYIRYKDWNTRWDSAEGVVVFQVSYLGFGSQSDAKGFYYAPDGRPRSFGCDLGQEQREQQILFLGEGDNYVLTEWIAPNWYWYEQHW